MQRACQKDNQLIINGITKQSGVRKRTVVRSKANNQPFFRIFFFLLMDITLKKRKILRLLPELLSTFAAIITSRKRRWKRPAKKELSFYRLSVSCLPASFVSLHSAMSFYAISLTNELHVPNKHTVCKFIIRSYE